jgi:hypothetical protein
MIFLYFAHQFFSNSFQVGMVTLYSHTQREIVISKKIAVAPGQQQQQQQFAA